MTALIAVPPNLSPGMGNPGGCGAPLDVEIKVSALSRR